MLGASQAATVGLHFQENYCGAPAYSGFPVTLTAFGIAPSGWQNLTPMETGYSMACNAQVLYTLNQVVSTNTSTGGLNPLPNGTLNLTWSGNGANFSGFAGYGGTAPSYAYDGPPPDPIPTGEWQIYSTFIRDGVNFGVTNNATTGAPCGDNNQPAYTVDITGLKTLFTNTPFVIELIAASDSMQTLTNAFVIDVTGSITNSVTYPSTPSPFDEGGTCGGWLRGHGGGLSTATVAMNTDHVKITSNHPQHGGTGVPPSGFDRAGTISGFIITDKPVVTMSPQPVLAYPGDSVTLSGYAIGVPPLSYQWRKNGTAIAGATTNSLSLTGLNASTSGNYTLVVTNVYGSATSAVSVVTVDKITLLSVSGLIVDSNPVNPERDGLNHGATWVASSSDGTITRTGVMKFVATNSTGITVQGTTNFDGNAGTVSFWMRSAGTDLNDPGSSGAAVFDRPASSFNNEFILIQQDIGTFFFSAPGNVNVISGSASISDNKWHLITLTYDRSAIGSASLYVDGVLDGTSGNSTAWSMPAGAPIEIGFTSGGTVRDYDGLLDDVRVYNRQLTALEVASVFATSAIVDTNALQMQFTFATAPVPGISLSWQATNSVLQSAPVVTGTYSNVPAATSPYYVVPRATQKYYRYGIPNNPRALLSNPYLM